VACPVVYKAEREAGLAEALADSRVTFASAFLRPTTKFDVSPRVRAIASERALAAKGDPDLFYIDAVLVTTDWNQNDDIFDPLDTWVARKTPEDKPLNIGHDDNRIVGHMVSNRVVDLDFQEVADDTVADELPNKFHIVTGAVIYKAWATPELQEQVDQVLADIAKGEMAVSMEVLFRGFDYGLMGSDGSMRVVARNEKTAFLTKHLRRYGGSGKYGDERVGRVLRNLTFSGKGLVKNPANVHSVILPPAAEPAPAQASVEVKINAPATPPVYTSASGEVSSAAQPKDCDMTITLEQAIADLKEAKATIARLESEKNAEVVNDLKAQAQAADAAKKAAEDALKAATDAAVAEKSKFEKDLAEAVAKAEDLTKKLGDAEKTLAETTAKLAAIETEKTKADRVALVKTKLNLDDAKAAEYVQANEKQDKDAFEKGVEFLAQAFLTNNPQSGTKAPGTEAKPQARPKSTDKPVAPKSTDKPAPMSGKASEEDAAGEEAAAAADLDAATASEEAALQTVPATEGVSDVQKAIASYFGVDGNE
jgi:hypothetical protein